MSAAVAFLEFEPRSRGTEARVNRLVDHFGDVDLSSINQAALDSACGEVLTSGAGPATRIREVYTPVISILNFCAKRKWCDKPEFDKPQTSSKKTAWIAPEKALELMDVAAPHLRPLIHFILCTGARMSEALDLLWVDVDLAGKRVTFRDTKSRIGQKRDRVAALPSKAVEMLGALPFSDGEKKERKGKVFRTQSGEPYATRNRVAGGQIKTAWRTACKNAKITKFTPHDLRHTWATFFYCLTKDMLLLKIEGDWASIKMVERYAHLMPSSLARDIALVWGKSHPTIGKLPLPYSPRPKRKKPHE